MYADNNLYCAEVNKTAIIYYYLYAFCAADSGTCDRPIDPANQNQYIVWGIGSLGATAFQHHTRATCENFFCDA